jgi:hypothetical protein
VVLAAFTEVVTHHALGKQKKDDCQDDCKQETPNSEPGVAFALWGQSYSNNLSSELRLQRRINHRRRIMIQTARGIFND